MYSYELPITHKIIFLSLSVLIPLPLPLPLTINTEELKDRLTLNMHQYLQ